MEIIIVEDDGHMDFESISDFKWCLHYGGEVQFDWKGKGYTIGHCGKNRNLRSSL